MCRHPCLHSLILEEPMPSCFVAYLCTISTLSMHHKVKHGLGLALLDLIQGVHYNFHLLKSICHLECGNIVVNEERFRFHNVWGPSMNLSRALHQTTRRIGA